MDKEKRERLKAAGFAIGNIQDFLSLSDTDFSEIKAKSIKEPCFGCNKIFSKSELTTYTEGSFSRPVRLCQRCLEDAKNTLD
jgi:hypothetical protein